MSMVRSDAEIAIDQVNETCKLAADHYRSVRAATHDPELAVLFSRWEESRLTLSAALADEIRHMGNLPDVPDADREALEHLAVRLRAAFSRDEKHALIDSCEQLEAKLAETAESALDQPLPESARQILQRIFDSVKEARVSLAAARDD